MVKKSALLYVCGCMGALLAVPQTAQADVTARDLRTTIRTQWEFQPGQGPRRTSQREFFSSSSPSPAAASSVSDSPAASLAATSSASTLSSDPYAVTSSVEVPQDLPPPPPVVHDDWREPPRAEEMVPAKTRAEKMQTKTSLEGGLQISSYHYHESSLGVKLQGPEYGFNLTGQAALGGNWFVRGDSRVVGGNIDYKGSGVSKDDPNYIAEVRAMIGRDLIWRSFALSPYVGIGYRYLDNDLRGQTSTGAYGYVRRSQYLFAPIGLEPRMMFPNGMGLSLMAEFDPLLRGWQDSRLSDIPGYPDFQNVQKKGYGARGNLMVSAGAWSFGPFVNYWNINQSDTDCSSGWAYYGCGYEPHNHTVEYGMQFRYKFYEQE